MASDAPRDARREQPRFARREFLTLGTAAALSPWLGSLAGATELGPATRRAGGAVTPKVERLSVGYLLGSDTADRCAELLGRSAAVGRWEAESWPLEVVPATSVEPEVELGDADLWVRVVGLYPGVPEGGGPDAVELDVLFPSPESAVPAPLSFHAWSYRAGAAPMVAAPIGFTAVLDPENGLTVQLKVRSGVNGSVARAIGGEASATRPAVVWRATSLVAAGLAEMPRLRQGLYLFGVAAESWERVTILPPVPELWRVENQSVVVTVARTA